MKAETDIPLQAFHCVISTPRILQELSTLLVSLARQPQHVEPILFRSAADAAIALLRRGCGPGGAGGVDHVMGGFTASGLANLTWSFGIRGVQHDLLACAISETARHNLRQFGGQELTNLMWGLYRLVKGCK
jgi:hypothetical protein